MEKRISLWIIWLPVKKKLPQQLIRSPNQEKPPATAVKPTTPMMQCVFLMQVTRCVFKEPLAT